jgi:hypothetical protein
MTSSEFVIWLKGFTEACNDFTATPEQWDRIKEVLDEVSDNSIEELTPHYIRSPLSVTMPLTGSISFTSSSSQIFTTLGQTGTTRFDLTNLPPGTSITYTTKQQLND